MMNIIVIGLGSMGRRRIRLLRCYDCTNIIFGVDNRGDRRRQASDEFEIVSFASLDEAVVNKKYDAAFICTSPLSHANIISWCLEREIHVFSELNLVSDRYDENIQLAEQYNRVLFLSSTLQYRREIEYIKDCVKKHNGTVTYRYHVGQYLADWHPWENYKDFFVGERATNGCREFMAIDFPWIISVFGNIQSFHVIKNKISDLDIDYPDSYSLMLEHDNGNVGQIVVDVVSPKATRDLEIIGNKIQIRWDGTPYGLREYRYNVCDYEKVSLYSDIDKREEYNDSIIEDAYLEEIREFFDVVNGNSDARYSFDKDKELIRLIDQLEA